MVAFDAGGFFDRTRTVAGVAAWALVALLALAGGGLPRSRAAALAAAGLAGLAAWTAISTSWAPLAEPARDDVARLLLYLGAFTASALAWRTRREARLIEPLLAAGVLVAAGYGLAGRLLPELVELESSATAAGRLEQPLTYWNAMGALAAFGFILAARVAGDRTRSEALRLAAAAAAAPLGMAVYLSFSRGALAALAAGLAVLLALRPTRAQLRAAALALAAGVSAALASSFLPGVESLEGSSRARDGAIALAVLALVALAAALLLKIWVRAADQAPDLRLPRRLTVLAAVLVVIVAAPLIAASFDRGTSTPQTGAGAGRLTEIGSNRYDYWQVALESFANDPLRGSGTAGFRVDWLREREIDESVRDAHSLYLETAAELGLVGLVLLALFLAGVAAATRRALAADRRLVAGWAAAATTVAVHAGLDWDWEMPAVALPALVLAGALVARGSLTTAGGSGS